MPLHGSSALIGGRYVVSHLGELLVTGEVADTYHVGSDGDLEKGMAKSHDARATAGTSDIDVPHYAGNQISFAASTPGQILDAAGALETVAVADTIIVRGSTLNDGVYTVSNIAGLPNNFNVAEETVAEIAGDYVSLAQRAALSNNVVYDVVTGLLWARYTSDTLKLGVASDGELVWNDTAKHFALHVANNDLSIIVPDTLQIVGGAAVEVGFYTVGDVIVCAGFANAVNNYAGYQVTAVVVNGADLDITLDPSNNTLVGEVAANAGIKLCCQSAFAYAAGANVAELGGYDNGWRVPNITELASLLDFSLNPVTPALAAFPSWPDGHVWTSTTDPSTVANAYATGATDGTFVSTVKTATENVALVRLG